MKTVPFTIYDATGRILRTGFCKESDRALQAREGEFMLPVFADGRTNKVVDGVVVPREPDPPFVMPPAPPEVILNQKLTALVPLLMECQINAAKTPDLKAAVQKAFDDYAATTGAGVPRP